MSKPHTNAIVDLAAWAANRKAKRPADYAQLPTVTDLLSANVETLTQAGYSVKIEWLPNNDNLPAVTLRDPEQVEIPLAGLIQSICLARDEKRGTK